MKNRYNLGSLKNFIEYFQNYFEKNEELVVGYESPFYWEKYVIKPGPTKDLEVIFSIGGNPRILPGQEEHIEMDYEELYDLVRNKRFEDPYVSLKDIFEKALDEKFHQ